MSEIARLMNGSNLVSPYGSIVRFVSNPSGLVIYKDGANYFVRRVKNKEGSDTLEFVPCGVPVGFTFSWFGASGLSCSVEGTTVFIKGQAINLSSVTGSKDIYAAAALSNTTGVVVVDAQIYSPETYEVYVFSLDKISGAVSVTKIDTVEHSTVNSVVLSRNTTTANIELLVLHSGIQLERVNYSLGSKSYTKSVTTLQTVTAAVYSNNYTYSGTPGSFNFSDNTSVTAGQVFWEITLCDTLNNPTIAGRTAPFSYSSVGSYAGDSGSFESSSSENTNISYNLVGSSADPLIFTGTPISSSFVKTGMNRTIYIGGHTVVDPWVTFWDEIAVVYVDKVITTSGGSGSTSLSGNVGVAFDTVTTTRTQIVKINGSVFSSEVLSTIVEVNPISAPDSMGVFVMELASHSDSFTVGSDTYNKPVFGSQYAYTDQLYAVFVPNLHTALSPAKILFFPVELDPITKLPIVGSIPIDTLTLPAFQSKAKLALI